MKKSLKPLHLIPIFLLLAILSCNKKPALIEQELVSAFPNPCIDFFRVYVNPNQESETSVSIFGTDGKLLLEEEFEEGMPVNLSVNVSDEEEGTIHVLVENGDETYRQQVLKIN